MPPRAAVVRYFEHAAAWLALACAVPVVWAVGTAMAARLFFPGDIEWMEGATLVSAMRARDGLSLYDAPAPEYIPFIYPPLLAWLLGGLAHLFPLGYALGRAVSIIATLVASGALVFGARREGASWPFALALVGLFASCWDDGGTFYDLVRTDSLSLAIVSWSVVLLPVPDRRATLASGILLAVAFAAKQHVALLGIPMVAWVWWSRGRGEAKRFAMASVLPALTFLVAMTALTGGRFFAWLVLVPAKHGMDADRFFPGAQLEMWRSLPLTTTAALILPLWFWRRRYWAGIVAMTFVTVTVMRGHTGGYLNVLIPMFWVLSLLPAIASGAVGTPIARVVAGCLVALQLLGWQLDAARFVKRLRASQSPLAAWTDAQRSLSRYTPTELSVEQAKSVVESIRALEGRVLIPHAPWYAVMAGKEPSFALICLWDIDYTGGFFRPDVKRIDAAIAADFDVAVLPSDALGHGFKEAYQLDGTTRVSGPATLTGWQVKLRAVYRR
ncbi:MAG: hypothetical protein EXR71_12210 [Myxococcales bacterium]|nr:hypothetical protein [Myxococcales bacterium]